MSKEYGFSFFFFWQPHLGVEKKVLIKEEKLLRAEFNPMHISLVKSVYEKMYSVASEYENMWYIADLFEEQDLQIWIDVWGHVTPEGNHLVAQEISSIIGRQLYPK